MKISVFRIDDRLIHGQIITDWISYANATQIIVADDIASNDELTKTLLKMATPDNVKLHIVKICEVKAIFDNDKSDEKVLLLVRSPKSAYDIIVSGVKPDSINVGNMNMKKDKIKILGNMWVFPEDIEMFKKIDELGIECSVRAISNERKQDVIKLLEKI